MIDASSARADHLARLNRLIISDGFVCKAADLVAQSCVDDACKKAPISHIAFIKLDGVLVLSVRKGHIKSAEIYRHDEYREWFELQQRFEQIETCMCL